MAKHHPRWQKRIVPRVSRWRTGFAAFLQGMWTAIGVFVASLLMSLVTRVALWLGRTLGLL